MIPDERTVALLRVIGGIAGLLSVYADGIDRGEPVSAHTLRDLAWRLRWLDVEVRLRGTMSLVLSSHE